MSSSSSSPRSSSVCSMKLGLGPVAAAMIVSAALASLTACSSSTEPAQPAPAPAASNTAQEPEEKAPCDEGTYRVSSGACEAYPEVAVTRSSVTLTPARDHHTTAVVETSSGAWLYVLGGTDSWEAIYDDILRAKINTADGTLGAFEKVGKLPVPRAGHCMVRKDNRFYLMGGVIGSTNGGSNTSTVVVDFDGEGQITGAKEGPPLPSAVMHATCDLANDSIYVMGGRGKNSASTTLSTRAKIGADGMLGAFEKLTPLSPDRSHHASFIKDNRLYLIGGLTGDPTATFTDRKDVVSAPIGEDGKLGAWEAAGNLPRSVSVSAATLYKDAVYLFGGLESGGIFSDKIRRATFENGQIGPFTTLKSTLPDARGHVHQVPTYKSFFFSAGGKGDNDKSTDRVDLGRFDDVAPR